MPDLPSSPAQSHHLPPSLPNSPASKRLKTMTSAPSPNPHPPLLVKKLSPAATPPTRGSAFAAGYDIYSARPTTIPARGKGMVETDLAIAVPEGTCEISFLPLPVYFDERFFCFSIFRCFSIISCSSSFLSLFVGISIPRVDRLKIYVVQDCPRLSQAMTS